MTVEEDRGKIIYMYSTCADFSRSDNENGITTELYFVSKCLDIAAANLVRI
jgi:hypothetical protein